MDVVLMIVYGILILGFLVIIHEGGHFCAARLFGVRVTEFMVGLPGPSIGFKRGETRYGITAVPLGGYARICGMESGELSPHLKPVLASVYQRGTALMEEVAQDCGITEDEALAALNELVEWGSITGPQKKDQYNTYRTVELRPTRKQVRAAAAAGKTVPVRLAEGTPRQVEDLEAFYVSEYKQQYRACGFLKRSVMLLAGPGANLLFTLLVLVFVYSVIGFDHTSSSGDVTHMTLTVGESLRLGCIYIGMVFDAVIGLLNPTTVVDTVSNSASVIGVAVMSKSYVDAGLISVLEFTAMISVSLGLVNLLPIPPLDGGRFLVEIIQLIIRRPISQKAMNILSAIGIALFGVLFVVLMGQDIWRIVTGFWS